MKINNAPASLLYSSLANSSEYHVRATKNMMNATTVKAWMVIILRSHVYEGRREFVFENLRVHRSISY